jgi:hypothetical protein
MPGKIAKSGPRPAFGLPEALAAVHTSRLSCGKAGKTRIYTPIRASFGESEINEPSYLLSTTAWAARRLCYNQERDEQR